MLPSSPYSIVSNVAAGGGGWVRVLRQETTRDHILGPQLLRRVRQRRGHDERGRHADVLLPDPEAGGEETEAVAGGGRRCVA